MTIANEKDIAAPPGAGSGGQRKSPALRWRGFLLDEARHFFGKEAVKALLERMAAQGLNVFHWHLTDDQGWRIDLPGMPELVRFGARRSSSPPPGEDNTTDRNVTASEPVTLRLASKRFSGRVCGYLTDEDHRHSHVHLFPSDDATVSFSLAPNAFLFIETRVGI